jgi:hypothetical protein
MKIRFNKGKFKAFLLLIIIIVVFISAIVLSIMYKIVYWNMVYHFYFG